MLYKYKQLLEDFGATAILAGSGAALATGLVAGMSIQKIINKYKNKYTSCRAIEDPYYRDKCIVRVLNSMIDHLKSVASRECKDVADPAQCQYDILLKIEKLIQKRKRLETHLHRQDRAKIIDGRDS